MRTTKAVLLAAITALSSIPAAYARDPDHRGPGGLPCRPRRRSRPGVGRTQV
jgi:hypothetical protein